MVAASTAYGRRCSSLTGESDSVVATVVAAHPAPVECRNVVFASSLVMNGEGISGKVAPVAPAAAGLTTYGSRRPRACARRPSRRAELAPLGLLIV